MARKSKPTQEQHLDMTQEELIAVLDIIAENQRRCTMYAARYDAITGQGLAELLDEERSQLRISDYAVPLQYVPKRMMKVKLIRNIVRAGGIQKFLDRHKWKTDVIPSFQDIEDEIRRIRHKYDYCNWAFECIKIDLKLGGRGRFRLNYAQLQVLKLCMILLWAGVPINIVIAKARQWGGSTFCIFFQFWLLAHHDPYHSFAVAAHVQDAAHNVLNMLVKAIEDYPAWDLGLPHGEKLHLGNYGGNKHGYQVKDSSGNVILPGIIYIGSAERPETLRSGRISGAHYTEVGVWPDTPGKSSTDLVADISGGIPKQQALTMQVYESTAKTSDDFFHDIFYDALDGNSNFHPLFIPFYYIPHDTMSIPDEQEFALWLYRNRNKETREGKWRSTGRYYWWLWTEGATLQAIQWYRYEELNYTRRSQMVNEAPASAAEAFQSSGNKVFDFYDVDWFMKRTRQPQWEGDLISDGTRGADVLKNIRFISRAGGHLKIYEKPDPTPILNRYVVAVDIGGPNETSDYSSVRVMDRLMMMPEFGLGGKPTIVAEMHYHTDDDLLAYDAMRLAAWYNNALLVIESNTYETRDQNRDTGVEGFEYIMDAVANLYGERNLYARHNKEEDIDDKIERKWGFNTNVRTKPLIINHMRTCLRDRLWDEPSKTCCQEMSIYIEDKKKLTAPPKKHDDVLMATAILLWIAFKEMDLPQLVKETSISGDGRPHSSTNLTAF